MLKKIQHNAKDYYILYIQIYQNNIFVSSTNWRRNEMSIEKYRVKWIDLVRTEAIVFVVLCHATESVYKLNLEDVKQLSLISRVCRFINNQMVSQFL